MHIFLSPHLDDAVLSCGGLIHQLTQQGAAVQVITVMAGDPPTSWSPTPLIHALHQRWAAGENPMATRRAEDRVALAQLGAAWVHLTVPDAPYRTQAAGQALYTDEAALFGRVHPQDAAPHTPFSLPATLTALYVPLGAGQHVDHQVVREIGLKFREKVALFYYEEYPYSANNMEALYASGAAQTRLYGSTAVAAAQARLPFPLQAQVVALTEANMDAKIRAIACYRSQISTFWESEPHMAQRVRAYAREIAEPAAERLWFEVKEKRK